MTAEDDKVILTICDQSLSSSLGRILNTQDSQSFQLINIDLSNFLNFEILLGKLEHFKDKPAFGIILTDLLMFNKQNPIYNTAGVELIKHIRLTKELGSLCSLPIVFLSYGMIMHHLRAKRDNMLLISPQCHPIQVPFSINELFEIIKDLKGFESPEEMKEEIEPFIVWSKEDDVISQHDNFNRYGPFKLLREHLLGNLPDYLLQHYNALIGTLWFKKLQFMEPQVFSELPATKTDNDELYKETIAGKRILYIDDEHRLGWSFSLYGVFANNVNQAVYKCFQGKDPLITSPDGKLTCIDSYNEASKLFDSYKSKLKSGFDKFKRTGSTDDLHAFEYDIVILDLRLEKKADKDARADKISGIKLLNKIMDIDPSIPIIVFTASEKALNYREAIDHGAKEYWIKMRNTVSDLKEKIIKCLQNSEKIRKLWLDIRKVEEKKDLFCCYEEKMKLQYRPMDNTQRWHITFFLKESFLLLQRGLSAYEKSVCNYNNNIKIAVSMGLIQEERLFKIKSKIYDKLKQANLIPDVEKKIKEIRNNAVHKYGKVTHEDSLYIFEKTLELCLSDKTLRCKS